MQHTHAKGDNATMQQCKRRQDNDLRGDNVTMHHNNVRGGNATRLRGNATRLRGSTTQQGTRSGNAMRGR